jgi:hypothetical protein
MRSDQLRFEVGQRVQCNMGWGRWESGTIIQLFYVETFNLAIADQVFPYQIRLDREEEPNLPNKIFASVDDDFCVKLPDGIVDDGKSGYDAFQEESLDLTNFEFPPQPDCPVCSVPLQLDGHGQTTVFMQCCGKSICTGCSMESALVARKRGLKEEDWGICAFCRAPPYKTDQELCDSLEVLSERGSAIAVGKLAAYYNTGSQGVERDPRRALDLMHRAVSLGDPMSAMSLAHKYKVGEDVKVDREKAKRLLMMGARLGGRTGAFNAIANMKLEEFEDESSVVQYFIKGAKHGDEFCLKNVLNAVQRGHATQEEYREALVACNVARKERMSETREFCRKLDTELQMTGALPPREFEGLLRAWSRNGKNLAIEMNKLLQG